MDTKKIALGGIVILLLGGYALWASTRQDSPTSTTDTSVATSTGSLTGTVTTPTDIIPTPTPTGQYKDGTYTGNMGDAAPFGEVQVSVVISGGKISKVNVLKHPQGPGYTDELAGQTFPKMAQEAVTIQSANVDMISGATQNVQGFRESMQFALNQARN